VNPLSTELHEPALQCIEQSRYVLSASFLREIYASKPDKHKTAIQRSILGEKDAALVILIAVDHKTDFRLSELRITSHHDNSALQQLIEKHFDRITAGASK